MSDLLSKTEDQPGCLSAIYGSLDSHVSSAVLSSRCFSSLSCHVVLGSSVATVNRLLVYVGQAYEHFVARREAADFESSFLKSLFCL